MKKLTKNIMKYAGITLAAAGVASTMAGAHLLNQVYENHNPSYYVIEEDSKKDFSKLEQKLSKESTIIGEKKIPVYFAQSTIDEFRDKFKEYYATNFNKSPKKEDVTQDQLVKFVSSYVGEKLSYRWPVGLPQKFVNGIRKLPFGMDLMPKKQNEYFHNLSTINIAGKTDRMTDCWDYSQLFKSTFNILSSDYEIGSEAYRVFGKTYFFDNQVGDHDFNAIIDKNGNKVYVDSNAQDTLWINNPLYMTDKVKEKNTFHKKNLSRKNNNYIKKNNAKISNTTKQK